jgi:hypothetical protein
MADTTTTHDCDPAPTGHVHANPAWPTLRFGSGGTLCGPWPDVQAYLTAEGYEPGYAGNPRALLGQGAGLAIDADVAATVPCPACGATGSRFEAWSSPSGGYGAAAAVCGCGHALTF